MSCKERVCLADCPYLRTVSDTFLGLEKGVGICSLDYAYQRVAPVNRNNPLLVLARFTERLADSKGVELIDRKIDDIVWEIEGWRLRANILLEDPIVLRARMLLAALTRHMA